jgi:C4-dicarboxylate transporter DctQ subunit
MTLLVFVEVVLRFGFNEGILWAQELTLLLSAWMVLFGASYGVKVGSHIGVDALVKIMPSQVRRVVSAVAVMLCLAYCGLFLKGSWVYLNKLFMIGIELEDIPVPKWVALSILLIGFGLLFIRLASLLVKIITGKADGFKLLDEAKDSMYLAEEAKKKSGMKDESCGEGRCGEAAP